MALSFPAGGGILAAVAAGTHNEDQLAVIAAAGGDAEGIAMLYDRHAAQMLAIAIRVLRDREEAEDVLHDVFVEAWRRAVDYDAERGTVRAWLFRLTRSRALDRLRSSGRRRQRHDALGAIQSPVAQPEAEQQRDAEVVRSVLAALPEEQRAVLLLRYFDGLSSSQIAEHLGVPIGTVKSRAAAGLDKIRSGLATNEGVT